MTGASKDEILISPGDRKLSKWMVLHNDFGGAMPLCLAMDPARASHLALTTLNDDALESPDGGTAWRWFGSG